MTITGVYMDRSLNDFVQACEHCIANEQEKQLPDTYLIALLGDAVRLTRELAHKDEHISALEAQLLAAVVKAQGLR